MQDNIRGSDNVPHNTYCPLSLVLIMVGLRWCFGNFFWRGDSMDYSMVSLSGSIE